MKEMLRVLVCLCSCFCAVAATSPGRQGSDEKTNVIFIIYDDLRPELSIYGKPHMITPNFERLAKKSVTFDLAFCQIAVCNPSRDSLLTGLRPDTTGTHGFQHSFRPNMIFPAYLAKHKYATAGYGKILHWDGPDSQIWTEEHHDGGWKKLTQREQHFMNATTSPDKVKPESEFLDYNITSRLIHTIERLHANQMKNIHNKQPFLAAIGFKLPHVPVHVPFKFFDMYRDRLSHFSRPREELSFPPSSPLVAHKCCASSRFSYLQKEGTVKSKKSVQLSGRNARYSFKQNMHTEIMWGYAAAVTFLDVQLGRILDTLDRLQLWETTSVVLTSDHGMHNGEKGIWEKWTLFDEATRVPLLISHPSSPEHIRGQHYPYPVELVDIFPTLVSLLQLPLPAPGQNCLHDPSGIHDCRPLEGKSLQPVLMGLNTHWDARTAQWKFPPDTTVDDTSPKEGQSTSYVPHPHFVHAHGMEGVAMSQAWRCAKKKDLAGLSFKSPLGSSPGSSATTITAANSATSRLKKGNPWFDCNVDATRQDIKNEVSVDRQKKKLQQMQEHRLTPSFEEAPLFEELYDHRGETTVSYTHSELQNLAAPHRQSGDRSPISTASTTTAAFSSTKSSSDSKSDLDVESILKTLRGKYLEYLKQNTKK